MCTPAGQEEFFLAVGTKIDSRTSVAPPLTPEQQAERVRLVGELLPTYRTEMMKM
jgi:hypothetical protein